MVDVAERRGVIVDAGRLATALGVPVVELDPRRRSGREALEQAVDRGAVRAGARRPRRAASWLDDDELAVADERFAWVDGAVLHRRHRGPAPPDVTDRVDRWVTAPVIGPLLFLLVMWGVFELTTTVATPLQDAAGPAGRAAR